MGKNNMDERNLIMLRQRFHLEAQTLMREGNYLSAIEILKSTLANYGHNVAMQADLARCYWLRSDWDAWTHSMEQLYQEFQTCELKLGSTAWLYTITTLGRFFSEVGELAQAQECFRKAMAFITDKQQLELNEAEALAQALLIEAEYFESRQSARMYHLLNHFAKNLRLHHFHLHFALSVGAFHFENFTAGEARLLLLLMSSDLSVHEQDQIFAELIYQSLTHKKSLATKILRTLSLWEPSEPSMRWYQKIFRHAQQRTEDWNLPCEDQPLLATQKLRQSVLCLMSCHNEALANELTRSIQQTLRTLSPSSRRLWLQYFKQKTAVIIPEP